MDTSLLAPRQIGTFGGFIAERWQAISHLNRGLVILVAIRLLIALLIMQDVMQIPPIMRRGWYLHHGGDQEIMFRLARSVVDGHPTREVTGIGISLVMAFFIWLVDAQNYFAIVVPMVLVNGFVLGGLSVAMLGALTWQTTRNTRVALWAAGIWAVAPLLTYIAYLASPLWLGFFVPKIGWLNGLSDPPAAFLMLLAVTLLARLRHNETPPSNAQWMVIGLSLGAMIDFRVHLLFAAVFLLGYVLMANGKSAMLWTILGGIVAYLPQAAYNLLVYRVPFTTGYIAYSAAEGGPSASELMTTLPFRPGNLVDLYARQIAPHPEVKILLIVLGAAILVSGVVLWKRRGWQAAALLVGAPLSYLLPMTTAWPFAIDPVRFSLPVIPFFVVIVVYFASRLSRIRIRD